MRNLLTTILVFMASPLIMLVVFNILFKVLTFLNGSV